MEKLPIREIRRRFLDFFARHGHTIVPSSSLVPHDDPTLLFANAGMNQFKDVFTGRATRPFTRATSSQKCVRAGGKHNDLENVGRTARHHTFFEMLGNFSFGDYFKRDAIRFAWTLLTEELGIPQERMVVTVFGGDEAMGVGADTEARALWRELSGLPDARILDMGYKDNFWVMGETGPCGPCSEIHYHQGDDIPCTEEAHGRRCLGAACDCDRWVEIWNLVFMQFERKAPGAPLTPLPAPSIDTGAGLERVGAVLQGVRSNYDTDLIRPLIALGEQLSGKPYVSADYAGESVSLRAIADHARAAAFLIAEGVFPEKTGREYVLRRIMRRAIYHGWLLGIARPFLHEVAARVIELMGPDYPELVERRAVIEQVMRQEEVKFRETLDRGMKLLDDEFRALGKGAKTLPGAIAFKLYDTYGVPLDLTEMIAARHGFALDLAGFEAAMGEQRARSVFDGGKAEDVAVYQDLAGTLPATEFVGYEATLGESEVLAIVAGGKVVAEAGPYSGVVNVVVKRTPFYAEQGGQIGDAGVVEGPGVRVRVDDCRKPAGDLYLHTGEVLEGTLRAGAAVRLRVDVARRDAIRRNHSATHLLHWALRTVLGEHAAQKGSLVAPDRLRFDFSHGKPLSAEEKETVERLVNERVLRNAEVTTDVLPIAEAKAKGAMAFFGDKYGDRVRMVQMDESKELCGGTHARRTGDIGLFKILAEGGIAQGVRRIEATTGNGAVAHVQRMEDELEQAGRLLKAGAFEVAARVEKLQHELRERDREIEALTRKLAVGGAREAAETVREIDGVKVVVRKTEVADAKALRDLGDALRDKLGSGVIVLGGAADGKVALCAMVTKDLVGRFHAGKLIGELAKEVGGKGGGRPDMAQAGGSQPEHLDQALAKVFALLGG
ncbi:MAG TPA: alanine--tRNA ligase [Polyangia bacterium]|jgi:alanyl-tRNA synthetase